MGTNGDKVVKIAMRWAERSAQTGERWCPSTIGRVTQKQTIWGQELWRKRGKR